MSSALERKDATHLDLVTRRWRPLLRVGIRSIRKDGLQESIAASRDEAEKIVAEDVLVLVRHAGDVIRDVAGVMTNEELIASVLEVSVGRKHAETLDEGIVGRFRIGVSGGAGVIESGEDARRSFLFD